MVLTHLLSQILAEEQKKNQEKKMKTKSKLSVLGGLFAVGLISGLVALNVVKTSDVMADTKLPVVTVYKSPTCGCCKNWVKHLEFNGFKVEAHDVSNLYDYKVKAKLGPGLGSCHTAFVDGYAIEGHVPARDIKRLLQEKPDVSGLTVPGMPQGSPGMEMPGKPADHYKVITFKDGVETGVFSEY
jgi:hypothetical protein